MKNTRPNLRLHFEGNPPVLIPSSGFTSLAECSSETHLSFTWAMKFERIWTNGSCAKNLMEFYYTGVFGELGTIKSSKSADGARFMRFFHFRCSEQHVGEPVGGIKASFSAESASFAFT
ncbi:hypothetical protein CDAR_179051 [Caerostris darwini]|uniref:Uncharacterized protein n=1 Tax=Caerostris darwini TaxID=1538125 RepID=A0AAV4PDR9_9ARAC|nr:hypothetical protein CDAR_179051 [Caerostris darwini]